MAKKVVLSDSAGNVFHLESRLGSSPETPIGSMLRDPLYARNWLGQFVSDGSQQWRELLTLIRDPFTSSLPISSADAVERLMHLFETGQLTVTLEEQKVSLHLQSSEGKGDDAASEDGEAPSRPSRMTTATVTETHTCTIDSLLVEEVKNGRKPGSESILQVVPPTSTTKSLEVNWHGFKVMLAKEYDGKASMKADLTLDGAKEDRCYRLSVTDVTSGWEALSTKTFEIAGLTEEEHELWTADVTPRKRYVRGRGCDGATKNITLEVYPDQQYSAEISLDAFGDWVDAVNNSWKNFGLAILNLTPVEISPEIKGPKGYLKGTWGWQENKDWRAYFQFEADAGLDPIFGVGINVSLSIVKLAATAAGIPPPISSLLAEHIADIILSAGVEGATKLCGQPKGRRFARQKWQSSADATFSVSGALIFAIMARIGSKYVISVSIQGSVETKLIGESKTELDNKGLFITPLIKIEPFTVKVKVRLRAFVVISKSKEKKWTPWKKEYELWKGKKRKLFPK